VVGRSGEEKFGSQRNGRQKGSGGGAALMVFASSAAFSDLLTARKHVCARWSRSGIASATPHQPVGRVERFVESESHSFHLTWSPTFAASDRFHRPTESKL
jgi:hypothetical protein